jgi:hypothetical protein
MLRNTARVNDTLRGQGLGLYWTQRNCSLSRTASKVPVQALVQVRSPRGSDADTKKSMSNKLLQQLHSMETGLRNSSHENCCMKGRDPDLAVLGWLSLVAPVGLADWLPSDM